MSGIAGIYSCKCRASRETVGAMLAEIEHRGTWVQILDSEAETVVGVRSGESEGGRRLILEEPSTGISVALCGQLLKFPGHVVSRETAVPDAELILTLYGQFGEDFIHKIDGLFTICIWDSRQKKLLVVRDRLGIKPLYYLSTQSSFVFASEIKCILKSNSFERVVDPVALDKFLSYGYVPCPDTLFKSIKQLNPGHMLICENGSIKEKNYWRFEYKHDSPPKADSYYCERFLDLFEKSVSRCIDRNPGAGVFLSGGLDTSGVATVLNKLHRKPFKAFTAGFQEEEFNEIGDAKILIDHLGLEHHTILIELGRDLQDLFEKIVWHYDAPFADTSAIPSYYVAKLAKEHVDTVLTGDFPDQLIGGSGHHVKMLNLLNHPPLIYRLLRSSSLSNYIRSRDWAAGDSSLASRIKRSLHRQSFPLEEQRVILGMPVPPLLKKCLYSFDMQEMLEGSDALAAARFLYANVEGHTLLDRLLYFDILSYALNDLMIKVERTSMAHGLVAISPFHDINLVEFAATIPAGMKIRDNTRKYIMREALRPLLPPETLKKRKQGFAIPIRKWLISTPEYVRNILLDSRTLDRGYFDKRFTQRMVENFLLGKTDYASGSEATIFCLITLELWHRAFVNP